jgi:hypothetical protein
MLIGKDAIIGAAKDRAGAERISISRAPRDGRPDPTVRGLALRVGPIGPQVLVGTSAAWPLSCIKPKTPPKLHKVFCRCRCSEIGELVPGSVNRCEDLRTQFSV